MKKKKLPVLESFAFFSNILPSWDPNCPDSCSFCPLSSSGQEKGYFGVGFGVFVYVHIPKRGVQRLGGGILDKMIPQPGKMRPMWSISYEKGAKVL